MAPKLERIGFNKHPTVSDKPLFAVAEHLSQTLKNFHISHCSDLTAHGFTKVLKACLELRHVSYYDEEDWLDDLPAFYRVFKLPKISWFEFSPGPSLCGSVKGQRTQTGFRLDLV